MDRFDFLKSGGQHNPANPYGNNSLTQFQQSDIPNYWTYAQNFVLGDNMFSSLMGPSFPNHLYTIAAQSGGSVDNPRTDRNIGTLGNANKGWGCDIPNKQVKIQTSGSVKFEDACFDFTTLAEKLDAKGVTWVNS